jgi:hypothetical protein
MTVIVVCDILLALAFAFSLLAAWALSTPAGPEGPVGAWLLFLPPLGLTLIALIVMLVRHRLDWVPGGPLVLTVAVLGVLTSLVAGMIAAFDRNSALMRITGVLAPILVLIGCVLALHAARLRPAGILFALAAVSGWILWGIGGVSMVRSSIQEANEEAQADAARESEYAAQEVAEYRALPADVGLSPLLGYTWSRDPTVRNEARARVAAWPGLDDALIQLLDRDNENAISYVSHVMEKPPARFAAAWGGMMERQMKHWAVLEHDEYAGKWEPNLSVYLEGARKIHESGGDLSLQLKAWYEFLRKCKGLGNLAAYVKTLIRK